MNSETKVGAFTLAGAALLAGIISFMGAFRFSSKAYGLTIVYPDAQGLLNGAEVRYAGVHIGVVKNISVVNNKASVETEIDEQIKLPEGAVFGVGADGVMGAKFVSIMPPQKISSQYIKQGSIIEGDAGAGIDSFLQQSSELLSRVGVIVENLDNMLTNETIQRSLNVSAKNMTEVTNNLREVTKHLNGIVGVIDGVSQEPATAQALRETIYNVRDTSAGAKKIVKTISDLEVDADVGHNMKGGHWRGNMGVTLHPSKQDSVYLGGYDIGDENKFDFIVGRKFGPAGVSAGSMQGEFGVGLSYDVIKNFRIYSQYYDFDKHKLRIGAEIPLNKNVSVYGETMDARHGTKRETYAGMRARF
ncbi:MAG: MlaD family protein [Phascolarctobacterium sp.]|nr:MlaD family protein [Phascolarctobacterium sp.]